MTQLGVNLRVMLRLVIFTHHTNRWLAFKIEVLAYQIKADKITFLGKWSTKSLVNTFTKYGHKTNESPLLICSSVSIPRYLHWPTRLYKIFCDVISSAPYQPHWPPRSFLTHTQHTPTSGPLPGCSLCQNALPQIAACLTPLPPSSHCSNGSLSVRSLLTTLCKMAIHPPLHWYLQSP